MINILGIDCATKLNKTGFSLGVYENGQLKVLEALIRNENELKELVSKWFNPNQVNLIAIDAPLGWPEKMALNLGDHSAGKYLEIDPNQMFRRETDRFVNKMTKKQPFDVGADKIARTTLAALKLIHKISCFIGRPIPLAWDPKNIPQVSVIEVYPTLTLKQHNIRSQGYKKKRKY